MNALDYCRRALGMPNSKKRAVATTAAEALGIPSPNTKVKYRRVLERFKATHLHGARGDAFIERLWSHPTFQPASKYQDTSAADNSFLKTFEWRQLRMIVLKKRGARCECCGASPRDGIVIHVDHIKPRRKYPELALTESNLQVLCEVCNHGKGSWDETDWRPDSQTSGEALRTPVTRSGDGDGNHSLTALPRLVRRTQEERGDISTRLDLSQKKMA